jgi:hypothetical protein
MPVIKFHVLSIPDAEEAIAETWRILVENDIPSPAMTFTFRGSSRVNITLRVDDPVDARTLMLRLAPWARWQTGGRALLQEMQPTRDARTFAYQPLRRRTFSTQNTIETDGLTPPFGATAIRLF